MATVTTSMLNENCTLKNPVKDFDDSGGSDAEWEDFVTTRAYFRKSNGFNNLVESFNQLVSQYKAYIYWRSDIEKNITKDTRITREGKDYSIVTWNRYQEKRMFIEFTLIEII